MVQQLDDGEIGYLVRGAQARDKKCCARLYELFGPRLLRYLRRMVKDELTAEDLVAEAFVRMLERVDRYETRGTHVAASFTTWLFRIAHNLAMDHFRSNSRFEQDDLLDSEQASKSPGEDGPTSAETIDLQCALERLSFNQRAVILMRFQEGLNFAEIATAMGKSEGAVKQLQARALAALARELEPERIQT